MKAKKMRYEFRNDGEFKRLLIILTFEELRYDIANIAYVQGDVARVHDNYGHDILGDKGENYMHQFKDVCEDGNIDRVKRTIGIATSEIEQMLYAFTATPLPHNGYSDNNEPKVKPEYLIEAFVPRWFSATSAEYLQKLAHEYVIDSVLEDWCFITYPEGAATWNAKKTDTADKIRHMRSFSGETRKVKPSII